METRLVHQEGWNGKTYCHNRPKGCCLKDIYLSKWTLHWNMSDETQELLAYTLDEAIAKSVYYLMRTLSKNGGGVHCEFDLLGFDGSHDYTGTIYIPYEKPCPQELNEQIKMEVQDIEW